MGTPTSSPAALVACNIYISAASSRPSHSNILISLLRRAQEHCSIIRQQYHERDKNNNCNDNTKLNGKEESIKSAHSPISDPLFSPIAPIAIIHAYADRTYDRSSFHLAGYSDCVSNAATSIIWNALNDLSSENDTPNADETIDSNCGTRHPYVGLVDHVSVMPLIVPADNDINTVKSKHDSQQASATAARNIGESLSLLQSKSNEKNLVKLYYYGLACPNNTPLATVRREKTRFFNSGGVEFQNQQNGNQKQQEQQQHQKGGRENSSPIHGSITIGAPPEFVENFNICLTCKCSLSMARSLTKCLRGRNAGGLPGVEALTLPYTGASGDATYEVACNLTNPAEGSVEMIKLRLQEWVERQRNEIYSCNGKDSIDNGIDRHQSSDDDHPFDFFVEKAYRVGTTEDQCIDVLTKDWKSGSDNEEFLTRHDQDVLKRFREFLTP